MKLPFQATDRRQFLTVTGSAFAALVVNGCTMRGRPMSASDLSFQGYGPLNPDPAGILDLPEGFSYHLLSSLGDPMNDGLAVPDKADGMGCFNLGDGEIVLVRNHELRPTDDAGGTLERGFETREGTYLPGGTTNIVLDASSFEVKRQFRTLGGTVRNCAGGITPWGSWLTCEEAQVNAEGPMEENHGWVFEVPASATGLIDPVPLRAMGRFNHEAACVDPVTGVVYETEDRDDGVLYRFLPNTPGKLANGGRLQAMAIEGVPDGRNWGTAHLPVGAELPVRWIDLENVEAPEDDLRRRAVASGATLIARGEGIHMGADAAFVCSTSGGVKGLGQIFKLTPNRSHGADTIQLFFESESADQFNYGDNLCVASNGHLIVCEDQYTDVVDNRLRGITPEGLPYDLGKLHLQTELAGACFSPDGNWLFVNAYSPARTFAITGPWVA